ncbi:MAG: Hsp20/alpha crystallin family protein [Spirochaetales bacterium]
MKSLVTYKPVTLSEVWGDFDRMIDRIFSDTPVWEARIPAVDLREEKDRYILEAELPGLSEKDIEVKVEDNLLTLSSKQEESKEEKRNGYILRERRSKSFQRCFALPNDVDREHISAQFKNGLLTLELKKVPSAQPKSIPIRQG